jgi:FkbM family methyltransferase
MQPIDGQQYLQTSFIYDNTQVRFLIDDHLDEVQRHIFNGSFYEEDQLSVHKTLIPRNSRIMDVGANIGNHTVYYGMFCKPEMIISVEPNPRAFNLMQKTLSANNILNIVELLPVALGEAEAFGVLNQMEAEFHNLGGVSIDFAEAGAEGALPIRTGDSVLAGRSVDFIKIDVESTEMQVLCGLKNTINSCRPIMSIEVMKDNWDSFKQWRQVNNYRIERTFYMYRNIHTYICVPE